MGRYNWPLLAMVSAVVLAIILLLRSLRFAFRLMTGLRRKLPGVTLSVIPRWKHNSGMTGSHSQPAIPVVALIRGGQDRTVLTNIGVRDHLDVHFAETCGEAWAAANRLKSPVVLCTREVQNMEWRDAVRILSAADSRPCVILASAVVDNGLWHEVIAQGGYEVLRTPLREEETTRAINLALAYRRILPKIPSVR
jgi:hypothetical protein